MKNSIFLCFCLLYFYGHAQEKGILKWWNPAQNNFSVIEGQAWPDEVAQPYDRLPARAKEHVSKDVWNLSKQSAGLMVRFRTNSPEIKVQYQVKNKGSYAMNHMPATGVSGMDLYAIDSDGKELWCAANRTFSDTITYTYKNIDPNGTYHTLGREYRLYLPLYNQVQDLKIGTRKDAYFKPLSVRKEKPIVVYGTSIAQGACASRQVWPGPLF